jgi:hypothetical protein
MQNVFIESFNGRMRDELLNETLLRHWPRLALPSDVGGPTTTARARIRNLDGKRLPSSPSPSIRVGIWRCALPTAPRQFPSLTPFKRANPTIRANSELDKTWGATSGRLRCWIP